MAALTLAALGVVYGDIGTSPLYALKEVFATGRVPATPEHILGILSLMFWLLTLVVSLKYVTLILRADNHGEGGLVAMLALASMAVQDRPVLRRALLGLGMLGTAIFFGDGVITPAISVLSAVEGLEVAAPGLQPFVVPLTLAVLTALFALQKHGTARVGALFGPVMLLWFAVLAALGLGPIVQHPQVLAALSPHHAWRFVIEQPAVAFAALAAIVLCVTGAEALYADMGHFGRRPIRLAWFGWVMPALVLNYFGQGALLLAHPQDIDNPFFELAPRWALAPLVLLATVATVIASQALISAAFSVTKQVIQLGYLPRLRIIHTSARAAGQIYLPLVNWALYAGVVVAVAVFGSSSELASAYGIAVTLNMFITTVMAFFVIRYAWRYPWLLCVAATGCFLALDGALLAANAVKVLDGGWFPLVIGALMLGLMTTWKRGRELLSQRLRQETIDLPAFLDSVFLSPPVRVPGTAVFLHAEKGSTPHALLHNLKHNKVLHETNLFVTVRHHEVPWIGFDKRVEVEPLGRDCWQVVLHFGFKNDPDVPQALALLRDRGIRLDDMETSYFLSWEKIIPVAVHGLAGWQLKLFSSLHRNAASAADFLHLPANRVVELGSQIELGQSLARSGDSK
ncbi:potassium transporter Kup [Tepidimonas alkaliphilus]|uniref:potassium transporter Kup n=1 Tax=Tepidimonas alkaliphilus TaxID=2588942 RepID=UPI00319E1A68